jgi:hypothetical protein
MVIAVLLGMSLFGAPLASVVLTGLTWSHPSVGGAVVVGLLVMDRVRRGRDSDRRELELLDIAAQLRAGRTLREVMSADAGAPVAARLALAGRPMSLVVEARWGDDPQLGPLLGPALTMVSNYGGPAAPVFESAAGMLLDDAVVGREVRMASAGPLAQGLLVGGVPMAALIASLLSGSFAERVEAGGVGAVVSITGAGLTLFGAAAIAMLIRGARR